MCFFISFKESPVKRNIGGERARQIIDDMLAARLTLTKLAEKHRLDVVDLARWANREQNRRWLAGLCDLANFQTQLMLSQYRVTAANTLIHMAAGKRGSGDDAVDEEDRDLVRKACADLLKLTVRRSELRDDAMDEEEAETPLEEIRKMIYGEGENMNAK